MHTKTLDWVLEQNDDKIALRLIGELSRDTLLPLWLQRASFPFMQKNANKLVIFDLTTITRVDSAGFAILCNLIQQTTAEAKNPLKLENPPAQLLTLADLFGLSHWIMPLTKR